MRKNSSILKRMKEIPPVRLIVWSFFIVIVIGAFLLTLPISSRNGHPTAVVDALFTATSATCVTGLVVFDTWTHWNVFGQIVIISLIQIGGLGVVTFTTGFTLLMRRKLGLRDLVLACENTNGNAMDIPRLIRLILIFTFSFEALGALILMFRFIPKFGVQGIWISVFLAISAYCNAGFDILGFELKDGSLMNYVGDPLVSLTIAGLIIFGGLGFIVLNDIYYSQIRTRLRHKNPTHLNFHSIIAISITVFLLIIGTILFLISEYENTLKGMNFGTKLNASFFQSVSARTCGFASVNIGAEHDITKILTVILMFIGACPGSTGGGIKATTFVVLTATVLSVMKGKDDTTIGKRRLDQFTVYRSLAIFFSAMLLVLIVTGVILSTNGGTPITAIDALFESTSAFGTVGLTAGITPSLSSISKNMLSLTMFIGRVGPVSLALALTLRKGRHSSAVLPEGKIVVG